MVLLTLEALGFCSKGEGGAVRRGRQAAGRRRAARPTPTAAACRPATPACGACSCWSRRCASSAASAARARCPTPRIACVNGTGGWFSSAGTVLLGVRDRYRRRATGGRAEEARGAAAAPACRAPLVVGDVERGRDEHEVGEALDHGQQRPSPPAAGPATVARPPACADALDQRRASMSPKASSPSRVSSRSAHLVLDPRPDHRAVAAVGVAEPAERARRSSSQPAGAGVDRAELVGQRGHLVGALRGQRPEQVLLVGEVEVEGAVGRRRPTRTMSSTRAAW